jgi:hypothetical protein
MDGKFILENQTQRQPLDWGKLGCLSSPTHLARRSWLSLKAA